MGEDAAGANVDGATAAASPCPLAGPSSRRMASTRIRGCARPGWSATAVVAGLKAEPSAVVRGTPPNINEDSSAVTSASHSDARWSGSRRLVVTVRVLGFATRRK